MTTLASTPQHPDATSLLWTIARPLIGFLVATVIAFAGYYGTQLDARLTAVEQERITLLKELSDLSVHNAAQHAEMSAKLDLLLQQHGYKP